MMVIFHIALTFFLLSIHLVILYFTFLTKNYSVILKIFLSSYNCLVFVHRHVKGTWYSASLVRAGQAQAGLGALPWP